MLSVFSSFILISKVFNKYSSTVRNIGVYPFSLPSLYIAKYFSEASSKLSTFISSNSKLYNFLNSSIFDIFHLFKEIII